MMKTVAVVALLLAAASRPAHAEKTEETAYALSILPLVASTIGIVAVAGDSFNRDPSTVTTVVSWTALAGMSLGPSFGHWYAGKAYTPGLAMRLGGIAAAVGGALVADSGNTTAGVGLAIAGGLAFYTGVGWDLATVGKAVRRANGREPQRTSVVAPLVGETRGLAFATTF